MKCYYNDNDPKNCAWLRELISAGVIPPGEIDPRSIVEVRPADVRGFDQCHFFAGIGGWAYALLLANWPQERKVWTASLPCQPFSDAGDRLGLLDERHLWPAFRGLIPKRNAPVIFGEQVASADGRAWLAGVRSDLEGMGFAVGAADLCAAGVGAPHRRQRLWWVADPDRNRWSSRRRDLGRAQHDAQHRGRVGDSDMPGLRASGRSRSSGPEKSRAESAQHGGMGDASEFGREGRQDAGAGREDASEGPRSEQSERTGAASGLDDASRRSGGSELQPGESAGNGRSRPSGASEVCGLDDSDRRGRRPRTGEIQAARDSAGGTGSSGSVGDALHAGLSASEQEALLGAGRREEGRAIERSSSAWADYEWIICRDPDGPKARRVEAGTFPLDHGLPGRVGLLRGYGNAIVPEVAEIFIECYLDGCDLGPFSAFAG